MGAGIADALPAIGAFAPYAAVGAGIGGLYFLYKAFKRRQRRKLRPTVLPALQAHYDDIFQRLVQYGMPKTRAYKHADHYMPLYNQAYV